MEGLLDTRRFRNRHQTKIPSGSILWGLKHPKRDGRYGDGVTPGDGRIDPLPLSEDYPEGRRREWKVVKGIVSVSCCLLCLHLVETGYEGQVYNFRITGHGT